MLKVGLPDSVDHVPLYTVSRAPAVLTLIVVLSTFTRPSTLELPIGNEPQLVVLPLVIKYLPELFACVGNSLIFGV